MNNVINAGDKFDILDNENGTPIIARYQINSDGKPVPYEIVSNNKPEPVLSKKQKAKIQEKRLKEIELRRKQTQSAMEFGPEDIQSRLEWIKIANNQHLIMYGANGFDKDIILSKSVVDEIEEVGFPFNVKPDDLMDLFNIDDIKVGQYYRFRFNPNPRFRLGEHKLNSDDLETFVTVTRKASGNLAFIYI